MRRTVYSIKPPRDEVFTALARRQVEAWIEARRVVFDRAFSNRGLTFDRYFEVSVKPARWGLEPGAVPNVDFTLFKPDDFDAFEAAVRVSAQCREWEGEDSISRRDELIKRAVLKEFAIPKDRRAHMEAVATRGSRMFGAPKVLARARGNEDIIEPLRDGSGPLPVVGPRSMHDVDEIAARLHDRAPWLASTTTKIWKSMRAQFDRHGAGSLLRPTLLVGSPGIGKTTIAWELAKVAGLPVKEIDAGAGTAAFRIAGTESGWSSRQVGEPLKSVAEHRVANPMVVINEIDRVGGGVVSNKGTRTSMSDALLPLLERTTAARFLCPASGLRCDLSGLTWILTANGTEGMDPALLSRLQLIRMPDLRPEDYRVFVDRACAGDEYLVRDALKIIEPVMGEPGFSLRHASRVVEDLRQMRDEPVLH
jgi:ATP-dependent Lon protease